MRIRRARKVVARSEAMRRKAFDGRNQATLSADGEEPAIRDLKKGRLRQDAILDVVLSVNGDDHALADQLALERPVLLALVLDAHVDLCVFAAGADPVRLLGLPNLVKARDIILEVP